MKPIVDALMFDRHFDKPSHIQASTLPLILNGKNVIAQAQSGAGE
jgi:superfamily II DNA/RNA helicase